MKKTLSNMLDEVVDPKPDPTWNECDELPPPTGESVRIIGLDMIRDNNFRNGAHSDNVRTDHSQETIFGAGLQIRTGDSHENQIRNATVAVMATTIRWLNASR